MRVSSEKEQAEAFYNRASVITCTHNDDDDDDDNTTTNNNRDARYQETTDDNIHRHISTYTG